MLAVVQNGVRLSRAQYQWRRKLIHRQVIADHPGLSRRRLSAKLLQAWNGVQTNGNSATWVARTLMLRKWHRAGLIVLAARAKVRAQQRGAATGRHCWEPSLSRAVGM